MILVSRATVTPHSGGISTLGGHDCRLQDAASVSLPSQGLPCMLGAGELQALSLVLDPSPHVAEHSLHGPQSLQLPSI